MNCVWPLGWACLPRHCVRGLLLLLPRTPQSCNIYTLSVSTSTDIHTLLYLHVVISTDIYTSLYLQISTRCDIYGYLDSVISTARHSPIVQPRPLPLPHTSTSSTASSPTVHPLLPPKGCHQLPSVAGCQAAATRQLPCERLKSKFSIALAYPCPCCANCGSSLVLADIFQSSWVFLRHTAAGAGDYW